MSTSIFFQNTGMGTIVSYPLSSIILNDGLEEKKLTPQFFGVMKLTKENIKKNNMLLKNILKKLICY
jgi:hypothetical protein